MSAARPTLYDATGVAIPVPSPPPALFGEITPAGVESRINDRFREYPSRNLTPNKIADIMDRADQGDPYEWVQLCEEITEKDPKIGSVLQTRTAAVLGLDRQVIAPQLDEEAMDRSPLADEIAKFVEKAIEGVNFNELLGDTLDAIGKPFNIDWIDWELNADGKIAPKRFRRIPSSHVRWSYLKDEVRIWDQSGVATGGLGNFTNYFGFYKSDQGADYGEPLPPYTTVRALNNARRDHPTRAGLLRTLVWYYLFKNIALKDWVSYGDRYGMPVRIIKLDANDFQNPEMYEKARAAVRQMGTDASGVIKKDSDLEIISTGQKGGGELFLAIIDYIDKAIAQVVLGHELTSQGSQGGGNLGISAALQVRQDILEGDCEWVNNIIRRDVFTPMVGWNFGWENIDLTPELGFDYEPSKDLVASSTVLATVANVFSDFEFSRLQLRRDYGFHEPTDEEDVLTAVDLPQRFQNVPEPDSVDDPAQQEPPPGEPEPPEPAARPRVRRPDESVNGDRATVRTPLSRLQTLSTRRRLPKPRQSRLDRLAAKGKTRGMATMASWKTQLRQLLREAQAEGLTMHELSRRIVKSYPDLNVDELERTLREQLLLTRLFGRNTSHK